MLLNSKSLAKDILNAYVPLLLTTRTVRFCRKFRKQVLDNTKARKETFEISKEVSKFKKKKPFSTGFPARHKKSLRERAKNLSKNSPLLVFSNAAITKLKTH